MKIGCLEDRDLTDLWVRYGRVYANLNQLIDELDPHFLESEKDFLAVLMRTLTKQISTTLVIEQMRRQRGA